MTSSVRPLCWKCTISAGLCLPTLCREGLDTRMRVIDPTCGSQKLKTLKAFCVFRVVKFLVEFGPCVLRLIKSLIISAAESVSMMEKLPSSLEHHLCERMLSSTAAHTRTSPSW